MMPTPAAVVLALRHQGLLLLLLLRRGLAVRDETCC